MLDYFKSYGWAVHRLTYYDPEVERRYTGRAKLSWSPDIGVQLEAALERPRGDIARSIRAVEITEGTTLYCRMNNQNGIALLPNVHNPGADFLVGLGGWLSLIHPRVIFSTQYPTPEKQLPPRRAIALYGFRNLDLPHMVRSESMVGDTVVHSTRDFIGIRFDDPDGPRFEGRILPDVVSNDNKAFQVTFDFRNTSLSRREMVRWPASFCDALSILTGQTVQPLHQHISLGRWEREELRKGQKIHSLGYFSPVSIALSDAPILPERLVRMTQLLLSGGVEAHVCRMIFSTLVESNTQKSHQACELLTATTLEGALRTLYAVPFGQKFNLQTYLKKFRDQYLSSKWTPGCTQIHRLQKHLRDRNAHPDWLRESGGQLSKESLAESVRARRELNRFYGYMILAISGEQDLKPPAGNFFVPAVA